MSRPSPLTIPFILFTTAVLSVVGHDEASGVQFAGVQRLQGGIGFVTALTMGPEDPLPTETGDGCLYAASGQSGEVHRVCFDADKVVFSDTIVVDLRGLGDASNTLGITVDPDTDPAREIHLYIAYSDEEVSSNVGKIARAVSVDGGATYTVDEDFITGLGRSSFDHQTNGLEFGTDGCLYIAQGSNSNAGYDEDFAEHRLTSAILRLCFKDGGGDVDPAVDRDCGDGGTFAACDVEVYASGMRNPYDLVWHSNGLLYGTDNDLNQGFRDTCPDVANTFGCPCQEPPVEPIGDELNLIEEGGYYGSPNPYMANPSGLQCQGGSDGGRLCATNADCASGTCEDLASLCTDPLCGAGVQCLYFGDGLPPPTAVQDPAGLYRAPISETVAALLDGITEYAPPFNRTLHGDFCSDWKSDLLITGGPGPVRRYSLSGDGRSATHRGTGGLGGASGLDVVAGPDGVVYIGNMNTGAVDYIAPLPQPDPEATNYFVACAPGEACTEGLCQPIGGCTNPPAGDIDCDGLPDFSDPCPFEMRNLCAGRVAQCLSAPPGNQECSAGLPLRLDLGPTAPQTDCFGDTWYADTGSGLDGAGTVAPAQGPIGDAFGCFSTSTAALVGSYRLGTPVSGGATDNGVLQRAYPVANGSYVVNLMFAELSTPACQIGVRTSDVTVEGLAVYGGAAIGDGLDIYSDSLAQNGPADACGGLLVRSVLAEVTDGVLDLVIEEDGPVADDAVDPVLHAIEVITIQDGCLLASDCDDANACTQDLCELSRCANPAIEDGTPCDDGNPTSSNDQCVVGVCVGEIDDPDNDGLGNAVDPCPDDAMNVCFGDVAFDATALRHVRLNAGPDCASSFIDCRGRFWAADFGAVENKNSAPCDLDDGCPVDASAVFGCTDQSTESLFKCEHWDPADVSELTYSFEVPDGDYLVNILLMNSFSGTTDTGSRVFDVAVEGVVPAQLDNFDPVVAAGSDPVNRAVLVSVVDGNGLQIEFLHRVNNPAVKGIEVLAMGPAPPCSIDAQCNDGNACTLDRCDQGTCINDAEATEGAFCDDGISCTVADQCGGGQCLAGTPDGQQCGDANVCTDDTCDSTEGCVQVPNASACDDGLGCTASDTCVDGACLGVDDCPVRQFCEPASGSCVLLPVYELRVNINGPDHVGIDFPGTWTAEPGFGGVCDGATSSVEGAINGTADDPLFRGNKFSDPLDCELGEGSIPPGEYVVNLLFAELFWGEGCDAGGDGVGERVFDIELEGLLVESDVDIYLENGCAASSSDPATGPLVKSYIVAIEDGTLDLSMPASADKALLSAIEILSAPVACSVDADCDDLDPCTDDLCSSGFCEGADNAAPCDDGLACTTEDRCFEGTCIGTDDCPLGQRCNASTATCERSLTGDGTQPVLFNPILSSQDCQECHGDFDAERNVEPWPTWSGSMMAQAGRDPLFWAALDVANNDVPEIGDWCLRCHAPKAWLAGRSEPPAGSTDGCGLNGKIDEWGADFDGLDCHTCHRMIVNEAPPPGQKSMFLENGSFWIDDGLCDGEPCRWGPYDYANGEDEPPHVWAYSSYHESSDLCGTCHNVTSPLLTLIDEGVDTGVPFPIERTYDEWFLSDFGPGGESSRTCQNCHMPDSVNDPVFACDEEVNNRTGDMPVHEFAGANAWIPDVIRGEYPNLGIDENLLATRAWALEMLQNQSATVEVSTPALLQPGQTMDVTVRVTNLAGHKLPSGYSEGRLMWLNVQARDGIGTVFWESGAYDPTVGVLTRDPQVTVYEVKQGIWDRNGTGVCDTVDADGTEIFHFVLSNCIALDNRIPPLGFAGGDDIETQPVAHFYPETFPGSGVLVNYDDASYSVPVPAETIGPFTITATLFHQVASKEYIDFLADTAVVNEFPDDCIERTDGLPGETRGELLRDMWARYDRSPPVEMNTDDATARELCVASPQGPLDGCAACGQPLSDGDTSTVIDCLYILRGAVGLEVCPTCICDLDGSGVAATTDALVCLLSVVGTNVTMQCPACTE